MNAPLTYQWNGEAMVPISRHHNKANAEFVVGEHYDLAEHNDRSGATHRHYFASVREAWQNLPEKEAERFPTYHHLRKYALIKTGFYHSHSEVFSTKADALRVAAMIRPIDEFSVVVAEGHTVTRYTAKSQRQRAMDAKTFQQSKQAVLDFLADMIGVSPDQLSRNTAKAA